MDQQQEIMELNKTQIKLLEQIVKQMNSNIG